MQERKRIPGTSHFEVRGSRFGIKYRLHSGLAFSTGDEKAEQEALEMARSAHRNFKEGAVKFDDLKIVKVRLVCKKEDSDDNKNAI